MALFLGAFFGVCYGAGKLLLAFDLHMHTAGEYHNEPFAVGGLFICTLFVVVVLLWGTIISITQSWKNYKRTLEQKS